MSYEHTLKSNTLPAAGDLSTKQYTFVTQNSAGRAATTGAGLKAYGVQQNKPIAIDHATTVAYLGISKVVAGGTIARNAEVEADSQGRAITKASGIVNGLAMEAGVVGQIIAVQLKGPVA